ncbi:unnamed protein product [Caenorhabditis angaria]|uniref:Uncharacterized protein n=1 Tax=Caenorhabditis angaria TaxID=860376 RepID=A0A9P1N3X3_9PELO|nr:unnamed protein product [Caenorhabditis angaria]
MKKVRKLAITLSGDHSATRLRTLKCNLTQGNEMATMDSQGYLYIHARFSKFPKHDKNLQCDIVFVEGGLRNDARKESKNDLREVKKVANVGQNVRLWVNADAFLVRCFEREKKKEEKLVEKLVWEKPFAGLEDRKLTKYQISQHADLESINNYGNPRHNPRKTEKSINRYSIDILGFDSTSRTQFMRHLPRTTEIMLKLGYHFLYGYNKVADNSMVNLGPILIGDMPEAISKPKFDESGDINLDWILPQNDSLDPTNLRFLWNVMKEKYGCETLFNEDISRAFLGLFNYPQNEFKGGFTKNPADHYFRKYYLAIYKKWNYAACKDGDQIQWEFVQIWRRFAHYYKDICHFGFSFITTLTHESPFVLETLDERLAGSLSEMNLEGLLDNSLSIIMGDHGNRIGTIQYSYTGRIEERMPLMAIRLPTNFASKYPKQYSNFLTNKFKLTANFDIHQTLQDIIHMNFGNRKKYVENNNQRGISLFDEIPNSRNCKDVFVPENFCTCLEGVEVKDLDEEVRKNLEIVKKWFLDQKLDKCIEIDSLKILEPEKIRKMSLNKLSREGLRSKKNVTMLEITRKKPEKNDFINFEFDISAQFLLQSKALTKLRIRTEKFVKDKDYSLVYEPQIIENPLENAQCQKQLSIFEICSCLSLY